MQRLQDRSGLIIQDMNNVSLAAARRVHNAFRSASASQSDMDAPGRSCSGDTALDFQSTISTGRRRDPSAVNHPPHPYDHQPKQIPKLQAWVRTNKSNQAMPLRNHWPVSLHHQGVKQAVVRTDAVSSGLTPCLSLFCLT